MPLATHKRGKIKNTALFINADWLDKELMGSLFDAGLSNLSP